MLATRCSWSLSTSSHPILGLLRAAIQRIWRRWYNRRPWDVTFFGRGWEWTKEGGSGGVGAEGSYGAPNRRNPTFRFAFTTCATIARQRAWLHGNGQFGRSSRTCPKVAFKNRSIRQRGRHWASKLPFFIPRCELRGMRATKHILNVQLREFVNHVNVIWIVWK
jgi:hypothetical protein